MTKTIHKIKEWLKWQILARLRVNRFPSSYSSHSELGEDMMIRGILHHMGMDWGHKGVYVDIGAHHPVSNSNTWHFYRCGWSGINVDATPGSMELFKTLRPRDVNLECCVVPQESVSMTFYCFDNPLLNTLDASAAKEVTDSGRARLLREELVPALTVDRLLTAHLPAGQTLDLLSIDIEGVDELVLRSMDWSKWRPKVIVFERHDIDLGSLGADLLIRYLQSQSYVISGGCRYSIIMTDRTQWSKSA